MSFPQLLALLAFVTWTGCGLSMYDIIYHQGSRSTRSDFLVGLLTIGMGVSIFLAAFSWMAAHVLVGRLPA